MGNEMHRERVMTLMGFWESGRFATAGSRAQDAIKRLDCGTQPIGLMALLMGKVKPSVVE